MVPSDPTKPAYSKATDTWSMIYGMIFKIDVFCY